METTTLQEFRELSQRAFAWTSFDPQGRGKRLLKEHEDILNEDLKTIPEAERERYIYNFKKYLSAWLVAHSNCASSAITGASKFNIQRAEKANDREQAHYEAFVQFRERALKAINRRVEESKPESQKEEEAWKHLKKEILYAAAVIHGINTGVERGCSKALFVSSIYNKVETFAKRGDVETVNKAIELIRDYNEKMSVVITERHKFFKLAEVAENNKEKSEDNKNRENGAMKFKGGKVVQNWSEDRIQILFDEKPASDLISQLKHSGFRWSPTFGAWQRQNTNNGIYAVKMFLKTNSLL